MQAVEFETDFVNGIIDIPNKIKESIKNQHLKVILMYKENKTLFNDRNSLPVEEFNPRDFCGVTNSSVEEIESYLESVKQEWS